MDNMQKDLVLSINEYAYVLDETKGNVSCWVGPVKTSLSTSDKLVSFNENTKRFEKCSHDKAISLFATAPEGWYIALKNPAENNKHPNAGTANSLPEKMNIGTKINIPGPVSFALYPGQMAKVIKGHSLRSNQYLLARVYDADSLNPKDADAEVAYFNGQILVIKGEDVSFYIPPTGIEVIPIENDYHKGYVRDALSLERLEYCILKDEDGTKRYVHGPAVVTPKATEKFIKEDKTGSIKYRAIELSEISGVYVKVIANYKEGNKEYKTGEELFITGKDQMIYYPRPEHTFISYDGKIKHHAIAIPKGEGRYIMNRKTGQIKTVVGPAMYLPDPREEVVVRRVLSKTQCELWYPGNEEVLNANGYFKPVKVKTQEFDAITASLSTTAYASSSASNALTSAVSAININNLPEVNENSNVNRKSEYTAPRTLNLSSGKFEGAVSLDVWTGFAVNVISKDGSRKVVKGPQTIILDYDQTLDMLSLSTGKPKTTDKLEKTVFLRHENNRVSDIIYVTTKDSVTASIKISYLVNFDDEMQEKWFSIDNYVKHLSDWGRAEIKEYVSNCGVEDLYYNTALVVKNALGLIEADSMTFEENGMMLSGVEVLNLELDGRVAEYIEETNLDKLQKKLEKQVEVEKFEVQKEILAINAEKTRLNSQYIQEKIKLEAKESELSRSVKFAEKEAYDNEEKRKHEAQVELDDLKNFLHNAELEREKKSKELELEHAKAKAEIEKAKEDAKAEALVKILSAVGPELAAAMNDTNNKEIISAMMNAVSPYAMARGEEVSETINRMVRGTSLEKMIETMQG